MGAAFETLANPINKHNSIHGMGGDDDNLSVAPSDQSGLGFEDEVVDFEQFEAVEEGDEDDDSASASWDSFMDEDENQDEDVHPHGEDGGDALDLKNYTVELFRPATERPKRFSNVSLNEHPDDIDNVQMDTEDAHQYPPLEEFSPTDGEKKEWRAQENENRRLVGRWEDAAAIVRQLIPTSSDFFTDEIIEAWENRPLM